MKSMIQTDATDTEITESLNVYFTQLDRRLLSQIQWQWSNARFIFKFQSPNSSSNCSSCRRAIQEYVL